MSADNSKQNGAKQLIPVAAVVCSTIGYQIILGVVRYFSFPPKFAPALSAFMALLIIYPLIRRYNAVRNWAFPAWIIICLLSSGLVLLLGYIFNF